MSPRPVAAMSRKWLVQPETTLAPEERRAFWEYTHADFDYGPIFSMTGSEAVRDRVVVGLERAGSVRLVLVPGCGSRTHLERDLVARLPEVERIVATDYPGVVALAAERFAHPRVEYRARDSTALGWEEAFCAVVNVNAIVSESDEENRTILDSCYRALRPGGHFLGFFPTIFSTVDAAFIDDPRRLQYVDFDRSTNCRGPQNQIFYTPLRLRVALQEAGFEVERMEVFFCDDDHSPGEAYHALGYRDEDLVHYEHFVVCRRPVDGPAGSSR